jgi:peptidoglycan/LPS O-acetylase OafA/YrhL
MGLIYNQHDLIFKYGSIFSIGILISSYISSEKKNATDIALISLFLIEIWYLFNFIAVVYLVAGIVILGISINKNNVFCKLGIQAYSFYLLHGAIGGSTLYFISPYASNLFLKIIAVAISVILSISISHIFYKYIEVPSLSLSRKVKS